MAGNAAVVELDGLRVQIKNGLLVPSAYEVCRLVERAYPSAWVLIGALAMHQQRGGRGGIHWLPQSGKDQAVAELDAIFREEILPRALKDNFCVSFGYRRGDMLEALLYRRPAEESSFIPLPPEGACS